MNKETHNLPKPSGKIEILTYAGADVPTVKLFGQIEANDIAMCLMAIRGEYMLMIRVEGQEELKKQGPLLEAKALKTKEDAESTAKELARIEKDAEKREAQTPAQVVTKTTSEDAK